MSLSPIPIRILHKVCMLHVSLCFLRQNDRLAAYGNQLLQSILSAQIFGSDLLWMSKKMSGRRKETQTTTTTTKAKNTTAKHPPILTLQQTHLNNSSLPQLNSTLHSIQRFKGCCSLSATGFGNIMLSSITVWGLELKPASLRFLVCIVQRQELLGPRLWTAKKVSVSCRII